VFGYVFFKKGITLSSPNKVCPISPTDPSPLIYYQNPLIPGLSAPLKQKLPDMKYCLILLLFIAPCSFAQKWDVEVMGGVAGYNGDLTEHVFSYRTAGPSAGFNVKYNFNNEFVVLRAGLTWGKISANDKFNKQADLKSRNLSFQTNIWEASLCAEVNIFEPEYYTVYPYVFAGVGVFRYNPYTYDNDNVKQYLQPLGTEGQGLKAYPDRKPYSLTQFCLPFGGGMKVKMNRSMDLIYEMGGRYLFTDYLDDVSKTYANAETLMANSKPKSAELAFRQTNKPNPSDGDMRGNSKVKDWYFISSFKLLFRLGKDRQ
jgi:Domain of unknown function (DUF6089)